MKKQRLTILIILIGLSLPTLAQDRKETIHISGKATKTSIKLRWAPSSPLSWHYANEYGYTLERIIFLENGQVISNRKIEIIDAGPFKPAPLQEWEEAVSESDYAAIAAQSIYGESFSTNTSFSSEMVRTINQAREIENRFSFALYAADLSIKTAELCGLYYEDEQVHNDFKYLYKIYANVPPGILELDTGTILIGLDDYYELPEIRDFQVDFEDQLTMISWDGSLKEVYSAYWVERADEKNTFERITDVPIVRTTKTENLNDLIFIYDSLDSNEKTYSYRVKGIDYFGETGPPSVIISGSGKPQFGFSPSIVRSTTQPWGIAIEWTFPEEGQSILNSFDLLREDPVNKIKEVIISGIPGHSKSVVDTFPHSSNYYVIRARDKYDRATYSFPFFVQMDDSIPPLPPVNFSGNIDTLGQVMLQWDPNNEPDLNGYKLYRSNFSTSEFSLLPGPIITTNYFVDTVELKTLTEEIFYRVVALDNRFNPSAPSETLRLKKPDKIPPLPPVPKKIKSDSLGILLTWEKSPSEDAIEYFLYRRSELEESWFLIRSFEHQGPTTFFLDKEVEHKITYAYTFIAVDDDNLESAPARPVTIQWINKKPLPTIEMIYPNVDHANQTISLSWVYDFENINDFKVYKGKNGKPLTLYQTIAGDLRELIDSYSSEDQFTDYQIIATYKNGDVSPFSKKMRIEF